MEKTTDIDSSNTWLFETPIGEDFCELNSLGLWCALSWWLLPARKLKVVEGLCIINSSGDMNTRIIPKLVVAARIGSKKAYSYMD